MTQWRGTGRTADAMRCCHCWNVSWWGRIAWHMADEDTPHAQPRSGTLFKCLTFSTVRCSSNYCTSVTKLLSVQFQHSSRFAYRIRQWVSVKGARKPRTRTRTLYDNRKRIHMIRTQVSWSYRIEQRPHTARCQVIDISGAMYRLTVADSRHNGSEQLKNVQP